MRTTTRHILMLLALPLAVASCIENDIPYPIVEANITAFEVEGQCDASGNAATSAAINKTKRTVDLYIDDRVSLADVRITRMEVSEKAAVSVLNTEACADYDKFPRAGFASLGDIYVSSNTRVNMTGPLKLRLTTYQDYDWTVNVKQIFEREVAVENQVGNAVIDEVNHSVVIYVSRAQDLKAVKVLSFTLGGKHGKVVPDPTGYATFDFSKAETFHVSKGWESESTPWTVYVYRKSGADVPTEAKVSVFAMSTRAVFNGTAQIGKSVGVEFKAANAGNWNALDASAITTKGSTFSATVQGLKPSTPYQYRIQVGGEVAAEGDFTTAGAPQLTDGSFDNWHSVAVSGSGNRLLWNPWAQDAESFWDTGNRGATTVGTSNSQPTDQTCNGQGQAAYLESRYIVLKFAAGNIFTGQYVETDGTNGILDFGRPFSGGFPTKLRVNYKYVTSTINRCADSEYEYLKGRPDSCQIYIALADWNEPYRIRTRPSTRHLFDPKDPGVIAYAQITVGEDVPQWKQEDLVLDYYASAVGRTPKYILVVASASKYGDFFTGGDGSKLWIDNFELIYD